MCGDARDEYNDYGGDAIVHYRNTISMMFDCSVNLTPVWWQQKVQFWEVMVVMGMTPLHQEHLRGKEAYHING